MDQQKKLRLIERVAAIRTEIDLGAGKARDLGVGRPIRSAFDEAEAEAKKAHALAEAGDDSAAYHLADAMFLLRQGDRDVKYWQELLAKIQHAP